MRRSALGLLGLAALLLLATPSGAGAVSFFLDAVHGRVVDEDTGAPIADATVIEWVRGAGRMGGPQPSYHARLATTDAQGRFAFSEEIAWSARMWLFRTYDPVYGWYHPSYGLELERPRVGEGGGLRLEGSLRRSHLRLAALRPWCYGQRDDDAASERLRAIACPLEAHDTWPSGVPRAEGETDARGRRTGTWTFRYEDGSVAARGAYREGGAVGDWEFYERSGLRVR